MNYRDTIHLPSTGFPMRAKLPEREPEILKFWQEARIYKRMIDARKSGETYILHDGPPYSNGNIHMGLALNKVVKDFVIKYRSMNGYFAPYVPGWDNHGMPIENNVLDEFRKGGIEIDRLAVRKRCREYAKRFVDIQREEFKRLGVLGEWDNAYLTMSHLYESEILRIFAKLVKRGYIYRDLRPIHWCTTCQTALADAEIEYKDKISHSVWMRFPLLEDPDEIFAADKKDSYALVWTTTPWTIPANLAVTVRPDFEYYVVKKGSERYLIAKALFRETAKELGWKEEEIKIVKRVRGDELANLVFRHPIFDRPSPVLEGDFVTADQGTGIVHTAPGHGEDDFRIGKQYGLRILSPVDEEGYFTSQAGERFAGLDLQRGNEEVLAALTEAGNLLKQDVLEHQYPYCWRCHSPLIFRTTLQWFMNVDHEGHREKALAEIEKVKWVPSESYERIKAAIQTRPDWCLSRQRFWGVGLPAFYCNDCGEAILDADLVNRTADLVKEHSADFWFQPDVMKHYQDVACPKCGSKDLRPEEDILDVWFDSSCSSLIVCRNWEGLRWPVDLFLEGPDQHRGWFNVSLMTGLGAEDTTPYSTVVTNGWVVDHEGKAMHKSLGNYISTKDIVDHYGADVLRLWVASSEFTRDVRVSQEILDRVIDAYRKIRNTLRFLLGNLADFDSEHRIEVEKLPPLERYILHELQKLIAKVRDGFESFAYHHAFQAIYNFCSVTLSSFYLDVLKDTLYTRAKNSERRRAAQTVMAEALDKLIRVLAPLASFTAEEAYRSSPLEKTEESVFLLDFPKVNPELEDRELAYEFSQLLTVRDEVLKALESERSAGNLQASIDARVNLAAKNEALANLLRKYEPQLAELFIVSQVDLVTWDETPEASRKDSLAIAVRKPKGEKCVRCWLWSESVGGHQDHPEICDKCYEAITDDQT